MAVFRLMVLGPFLVLVTLRHCFHFASIRSHQIKATPYHYFLFFLFPLSATNLHDDHLLSALGHACLAQRSYICSIFLVCTACLSFHVVCFSLLLLLFSFFLSFLVTPLLLACVFSFPCPRLWRPSTLPLALRSAWVSLMPTSRTPKPEGSQFNTQRAESAQHRRTSFLF